MGQASTSKVRAKRKMENMQHMRHEQVHSKGYKVQSIKSTNTKIKQVTGKEWKLKRELVEAKLDGTIFSPFYKVTMNPIYNYKVQGSPN